ncbi:MAG: hypothetical protein JNK72_13275 [Myxococcales bacterium]|nr:hypothetical protein [Myxococcales bacterium]
MPRRPLFALSALAATLVTLTAPSAVWALEGQLSASVRLGASLGRGPRAGLGPALELAGGYGLNDAFTLYAAAGYATTFPAAPYAPTHRGWASAGLRYAFDYLRVVPVISVGLRGDLLASPYDGWLTPSAELRVGLVWMRARYRAWELDLGYAAHFLQREHAPDVFSVNIGYHFLRD